MTQEDVAKLFGVTIRTVQKWQADRTIPFFRKGHRFIRFRRADVEAHFNAKYLVDAKPHHE